MAIVTPGGVGGYFGGLLAKAGENVAALVRGAHLAAIKQHGLRIEGTRGDDIVRFDTSDDAIQLGVADIVVFAVKLYQIEDAARAAAPLFGPETLAISLLNGVTRPEIIARSLPGATVPGGCAYVAAVIAAPGHVRYTSDMPSIVFGAPDGDAARDIAADFAQRCRHAGFGAEITEDVRGALWNKLVGLSANPALIAETTAVARAQDLTLPADIEDGWVARLKSFPSGMYASIYHDIAKGGPLVVEGSQAALFARANGWACRRRITPHSTRCSSRTLAALA